jgi:hypothetical protein
LHNHAETNCHQGGFDVFISKLADAAVAGFFLGLAAGFLIPVGFVAAGAFLLVALACTAIDLMLPTDAPPLEGPMNLYYSDQR